MHSLKIGIGKTLFLFAGLIWAFTGFGSMVAFAIMSMAGEDNYKIGIAAAACLLWGFLSYAYYFTKEAEKNKQVIDIEGRKKRVITTNVKICFNAEHLTICEGEQLPQSLTILKGLDPGKVLSIKEVKTGIEIKTDRHCILLNSSPYLIEKVLSDLV